MQLDDLPVHPYLTHPHTGHPLRAIGILPSGKVCWPVMGAAEGDGGAGGGDGAGGADGGDSGGSGDGTTGKPPADAGGKTFSQAEVDRIVADRLARENLATLKDKAAKYDKAEADKLPELERAKAAAKDEGAAEVRAELTRERVLDKIEVAAAGRFTDPEDAQLHLGKRVDEFIKDGKPDGEAIKAAVDKLLEDKPHLAATEGTATATRAGLGGQGGNAKDGAGSVTPGLGRLSHAYSTSSTTNGKKK